MEYDAGNRTDAPVRWLAVRMPLAVGGHLGRYRIEALVGAGGMGEVYRARDTQLNRAVALKVLPAGFASDDRWRARFKREATSIAALSHPHICAVHDVGHHDGIDYLVMEFLEGETLTDRLNRGALPLEQAITYACEIADALASAHRVGIVHRDLKPANVMITRAGAKLLDFGLARHADAPDMASAHTVAAAVTEQGEIVGTLNYMAPEQLEGGNVDARTDVFAFGLMFLEMMTGRAAFGGTRRATVIGDILHKNPIAELTPSAPPHIVRLIATCVAKDPNDRWSSAHDVMLQLKAWHGGGDHDVQGAVILPRTRERLAWTVAAVAVLAALAFALVPMRERRTADAATSFDLLSVLLPSDAIQPFADAPQISPDGRHLAFVATDGAGRTWLYVRSLAADSARPLPGTEDASLPFWAPDSRRLGFFAGGQLKTTSLDNDTPQAIAAAAVPRGGTWNAEDIIVFSPIPSMPLQQVRANGGAAAPVKSAAATAPGTDLRWFPAFLPDGKRYLFLGRASPGAPYVIGVASLDTADTQTLVESQSPGLFATPGHLLYRRDGTLVAQPFDPVTTRLSGVPVPIIDRVGFNAITYQALVSVSRTGRVAYQPTVVQSELAWYSRDGKQLATPVGAGGYNTICLTPDEQRAVFELADDRTGNVDIWTLDLNGGPPSRLTFDAAVDFYPVCSANGSEIIFSTLRDGPPNLLKVRLDAPGSETAVLRSPQPKIATDISRDGELLVYAALQPKTSWDVFVLPLSKGEPIPLAATVAEERNARLSHDGRWIAYVSNESGRLEVYVQPFPATGARWQISIAGGQQPQWRRDGRELYYVALDKRLIAVDVKASGAVFTWGVPRPLMETRMTGWERAGAGCCQYAVSSDGQRFLVSTATSAATPISVALNWPALLQRSASRP